ncbi:efflux RND transporter permease subunit [Paraburkholderia kirstenboschensis]|uniref:MMPL family transporter n=1 Tax=Paraburkholderia kirstenboschensis TaxID=1245436 RepID=A0ABZ0EHQ8_9BURK|nr:MMPL family transporter [Paraburkholderia kirstenboschensis]WOD15984.1 MMPL family transporter [Paraburkholderia kirstenboschensis]
MHPQSHRGDATPVVRSRAEFEAKSGSRLECLIFNNRLWIVSVCIVLTALLGFAAARSNVSASYERMMPQSSPFIRNYLANLDSLRSLGNSVRVVVENRHGSIYAPKYLSALRDINDRAYLLPGVDRAFVKSLWMPVVRWAEVTETGFQGGPVMPDDYDGSPESIAKLRQNVSRAGIVGSLIGDDQQSSTIFLPLLDHYADSGKPLDAHALHDALDRIRQDHARDGIEIHVIGFAQLVGDLIKGLLQVALYFAAAVALATAVIYGYTRCARSTALVIGCSLAAVVWQLGIVHLLGVDLDPYSILVPFLIFAIGVSHGAQKMNGIMQDIGRGTDRYVAARYTFRRLFLAGLTALLADAVGFAVLMLIDIPVICGLAVAASAGVAVLIFTNLVFLPVMLSYTGVSAAAASRSLRAGTRHPLATLLVPFTRRVPACIAVCIAAALLAGGLVVARHLKIGDLDPGAPELRATSRYNRDNAYITSHYGLSTDQFAVIVKTRAGGVNDYRTLMEMDNLEQVLRDVDGVQTTQSISGVSRRNTAAGFEGDPRWMTISRDPFVSTDAVNNGYVANPELVNGARSVAPVIAYLADHKAKTLEQVVKAVQGFAAQHDTATLQFLPAAGSAGIEAATNIAVEKANRMMLVLVYAAVIALCFVTFRNWRAVVVAVVPLVITSILCEALMVALGIGVKVATLPVTALGVGIGVDYALYLVSIQLALQRQGATLEAAYREALGFTGKVIALIGVTLAASVVTWAWSPIKFQADMGVLLTFMFVWNMVGALVLIPALSHFLLQRAPVGRASCEHAMAE